MTYFKRIQWLNVPVDTILQNITAPKTTGRVGQVVPLPYDIKSKIASMLKIDLAQCSESRIMLVYFPPLGFVNVHSDKPVQDIAEGKLSQCVILPLANFHDVEWTWHEITDSSKIYHHGETQNWKTVPMVPNDATRPIETIRCDSPFIADIGTWHSLKNFSKQPAIALSIRLMPWSYQDFKTCQTPPPVPNLTILGEQGLVQNVD